MFRFKVSSIYPSFKQLLISREEARVEVRPVHVPPPVAPGDHPPGAVVDVDVLGLHALHGRGRLSSRHQHRVLAWRRYCLI